MVGFKCILFKTAEGSVILHTHDTIRSEITDKLAIWSNRTPCERRPYDRMYFDVVIVPFRGCRPYSRQSLACQRRLHFHTIYPADIIADFTVNLVDLSFGGVCQCPSILPVIYSD